MEAPLSLDKVAFRFGEKPILNGISLDLPRGSFLGLVGPNGSGKTTLLRLAAGLLKPAGGRVLLDGVPMQGMSRKQIARRLALLPQSPGLPAAFTVQELVLMGRTPFQGFLGRENAHDRAVADKAMEMARCDQLADRKIDELSGGERQRVLMARALAQEPEILLLDEPTTHMDLEYQIAVTELVADLVKDGLTVLGVFHDLNLAACYCTHLAVLSQGRLVATGTPSEVLTSQLLSQVFKVELCLTPHPDGEVPAVLPPRPRRGQNGRLAEGAR